MENEIFILDIFNMMNMKNKNYNNFITIEKLGIFLLMLNFGLTSVVSFSSQHMGLKLKKLMTR